MTRQSILARRVRALFESEPPTEELDWEAHVLELRRPRFTTDAEYSAACAKTLRWLSALPRTIAGALGPLPSCYAQVLEAEFVEIRYEASEAVWGRASGESLKHLGRGRERAHTFGRAVTAEGDDRSYLCVPVRHDASPLVVGCVSIVRSGAPFSALDADLVGFTALAMADLIGVEPPAPPTGRLSPQRRETRPVRTRSGPAASRQARARGVPLTSSQLFHSATSIPVEAQD